MASNLGYLDSGWDSKGTGFRGAGKALAGYEYPSQQVLHSLASRGYLPDIVGKSREKRKMLLHTFKNHNILRHPYVAKSTVSSFRLQVNATWTRLVNKNVDRVVGLGGEVLHRSLGKLSPIRIGRTWQPSIEVGILP